MNEKANEQQDNQMPPNQPKGYPLPPYYYPPPYEEDEINLVDLWRVIWTSKWLIFLIAVLCTGTAMAAALLMTPIYRSEVLMAPVTEEQSSRLSSLADQFGGLAVLAGANLGSGSGSKDEALALLKSRDLTVKFIKDENLLPILFSENWDEQKKKWNVESQDSIPTMWDAYRVFNNDIRKLSVDRKTGLVTLSIEWSDPNLAADWAGKLAKRVNRHTRERAVQEAENNLRYLKEALTKTSSVEVQEAIYRIIESQVKTVMLAKSRKEYSFRVLDPPVVAEEKVKPKRKQIVMAGLFIGSLIGLLLAFIVNYIKENSHK